MQGDVQDDSCATGNDLERLKGELGTLRQAVGREPPFGREDYGPISRLPGAVR